MFGFFKKNQVEKEVPVFALAGGEIVPITQVNDPVFAGKMMGDGFAVIPASGVITSPVKGEVVNVFPTLHAVGIQTAGGLEVLVHMGKNALEQGMAITPQFPVLVIVDILYSYYKEIDKERKRSIFSNTLHAIQPE